MDAEFDIPDLDKSCDPTSDMRTETRAQIGACSCTCVDVSTSVELKLLVYDLTVLSHAHLPLHQGIRVASKLGHIFICPPNGLFKFSFPLSLRKIAAAIF